MQENDQRQEDEKNEEETISLTWQIMISRISLT
jgi:hypothetical protein